MFNSTHNLQVGSKPKAKELIKVCGVCLGDVSLTMDEIVECDECGISVHEGKFGDALLEWLDFSKPMFMCVSSFRNT